MRLALTCLSLLLSGCVGIAGNRAPGAYAQAVDSETNACLRFPAQCPGGQAQAWATRQRIAEIGSSAASLIEGLRILNNEQRALIDSVILDCVKEADFQLNDQLFGGSPTREQCSEVLERDANGRPVTRAMRLGLEKHALAMACIEEKLQSLRRGGFSLNQRYRLNALTGKWEPLSRKEVEALLAAGGKELLGTIEPDVVLKFPCPGTNAPTWRPYGEKHPFRGEDQGSVYQKAFGGNPARVAPRWGVLRGGGSP